MSTKNDFELLERLLAHDEWATLSLFSYCAPRRGEILDKELDVGLGTIRKTLDHMIWNVECWTSLISGQPVPDRSTHLSFDELRARFIYGAKELQDAAREACVNGAIEDEYVDPIDGLRKSIGSTILHVATHNTHHRAQLLLMLRLAGSTCLPELDVLTWEQEQKKGRS